MPSRSTHLSRLSDADLLALCGQSDALAWRELVRRYRRLAYGIPRAMGLQPTDADEVFQQTFAELYRRLGAIREPAKVEAWLVTASRRASLRLLADRRRRARLAETAGMRECLPAEFPDPAVAMERLRQGERVLRAVESLGEPCASLLIGLFSAAPRSYAELARELRLAVGSLGPTRARCLHRLRARLSHDRVPERATTSSPRRETQ